MPPWIANLPWYIKLPAGLCGYLIGQFANKLPGWAEPIAIVLGFGLALWVVLAAIWHWTNERRVKHGKPKLVFEATHLIALGLLIALVGAGWLILKPQVPQANISALESRISAVQASIDKYVLPRELTEEQALKLENFFLQRPKQKIKVVSEAGNSEASRYATQLYRAFERAHWEPISLTTAANDLRVPEGLSISVMYPTNSRSDQNVSDDLQRALKSANIPFGPVGSSRNQETAELYVLLLVGPKPRL